MGELTIKIVELGEEVKGKTKEELCHNLTEKAKELWHGAEGMIWIAVKVLAHVETKNLWKGQYDSFNEYCEDNFQRSGSLITKYIRGVEYFGAMADTPKKFPAISRIEKLLPYVEGKDNEKLTEMFEQAQALPRKDFDNYVQELKDGHPHELCPHNLTAPIVKYLCGTCKKPIPSEFATTIRLKQPEAE